MADTIDYKKALSDLDASLKKPRTDAELLSKFPEFTKDNLQAARDFVATKRAGGYGTEQDLEDLFPEFFGQPAEQQTIQKQDGNTFGDKVKGFANKFLEANFYATPQKVGEEKKEIDSQKQIDIENNSKLPGEEGERNKLASDFAKGFNTGTRIESGEDGVPHIVKSDKSKIELANGNSYAEYDERKKELDEKYKTGNYKNQEEMYSTLANIASENDPEIKSKVETGMSDFEGIKTRLLKDYENEMKVASSELMTKVNNGDMQIADAQKELERIGAEKANNYNEIIGNEYNNIFGGINKEINTKYKDYIVGQTRKLAQREIDKSISDSRREIDEYSEIPIEIGGRIYNPRNSKWYIVSNQYLNKAEEMNKAASNRGEHGFGKGLDTGFKDIDTWSMGMSDLVRTLEFKKAYDKYNSGEPLSQEDKFVMDAALTYMCSSYYNSPALTRGYKAGMTSAQSVPFMLEFIIANPAALQNAVVKKMVGYGMEKFAQNGARALAKEAGAHFVGTLAGAGMMTAAFGVPSIVNDVYQRTGDQIEPSLGFTDNKIGIGKITPGQKTGEAIYNSIISQFSENLSEMILTENPLTKSIGDGLLKPLTKNVGGVKIGRIINGMVNNPQWKAFATRAQWGGTIEEVAEEYINNLFTWGLSTDTHNPDKTFAENANLTKDDQIDIVLGIVPMTIGMGAAHIALGAGTTIWNDRNVDKLIGKMSDETASAAYQSMYSSKTSGDMQNALNTLLNQISINENITPEEKKELGETLINSYSSIIENEAKESSAQQQADEIRSQANPDGNVYAVRLVGDNEHEWNIVGGDVKVENGKIVPKNEDTIITIRRKDDATGEYVFAQKRANELTLVGEPVSAEQAVDGIAVEAAADEIVNEEQQPATEEKLPTSYFEAPNAEIVQFAKTDKGWVRMEGDKPSNDVPLSDDMMEQAGFKEVKDVQQHGNTNQESTEEKPKESAPKIFQNDKKELPLQPAKWGAEKKYDQSKKVYGNTKVFYTIDGKRHVGRYVITELDALTPSHNPLKGFEQSEGYPTTEDGKSINSRTYKTKSEQQDVAIKGNTLRWHDDVIQQRGVVISGNGRVQAHIVAANKGTRDNWTRDLRDQLGTYGFTEEQISQFKNPMVSVEMDDAELTPRYLEIFNSEDTKSRSLMEQAKMLSRTLSDDVLGDIYNEIAGFEDYKNFMKSPVSPAKIIDLLIRRGYITQQQRNKLVKEDGHLEGTGEDFIKAIVLGSIFDDDTISLFQDDESLKSGMMKIAGAIATNKSLGEYSIYDHIKKTIECIFEAYRYAEKLNKKDKHAKISKGDAFKAFTADGNLFDGYGLFELMLAQKFIEEDVSKVEEMLQIYNERALKEIGIKADSHDVIFTQPIYKEDIIKILFENDYKQIRQQDADSNNGIEEKTGVKKPKPSVPVLEGGNVSTEGIGEEVTTPKEEPINDGWVDIDDELRAALDELQSLKDERGNGIGIIGSNPELDAKILAQGTKVANLLLKKGLRKFADFCKNMIAALGDWIRPYLRGIYLNAKANYPEYRKEMDTEDFVYDFDVDNYSYKSKESLDKPNAQPVEKPHGQNVAKYNVGDKVSWNGHESEITGINGDGTYQVTYNPTGFMPLIYANATEDKITPLKNNTENVLQVEEKEVPLQSDSTIGTIEKRKHTQTGDDIWVVVQNSKVDDNIFKQRKERAKELGGHWSSFAKGFLFNNEDSAKKFNGETPELPNSSQPLNKRIANAAAAGESSVSGIMPAVSNEQLATHNNVSNRVALDMLQALDSGEKPYRSIVDLRRMAEEEGLKVDMYGKDDVLIQELVEDGLVSAARETVEKMRLDNKSNKEIFDKVVEIYELQPTISRRDSNRIAMQQYSTPLPMSFMADVFAYRDGMSLGFEPTAGNGMLLFGIPANKVSVNELDSKRLQNLQGQGFAETTQLDATVPFARGEKYDFVVSNPPFGDGVSITRDGTQISGLEQVIAINALDQMKDDGRAAIVVGGNMTYKDNGAISSDRAFYSYLYDHYNVVGVLDMDGSLYAKQGTTYPTRMILINGRRNEADFNNAIVYPPVKDKALPKVSTWDELYDTINKLNKDNQETNGNKVLLNREGVSITDPGNPSGGTGRVGREGELSENLQNQDGGVWNGGNNAFRRKFREYGTGVPQLQNENGLGSQTVPTGGNMFDGRGTNGNNGEGTLRGNSGGSKRTGVLRDGLRRNGQDSGLGLHAGRLVNSKGVWSRLKHPSLEEREKAKGVKQPLPRDRSTEPVRKTVGEHPKLNPSKTSYVQHNNALGLESVAPKAIAEAMDKNLKRLENEVGNIDEFVTDELGYESVEAMHNALAAEQVDAVAMAIWQMKNGQALIIGDQTGIGKGRQMASLIRWACRQGSSPG